MLPSFLTDPLTLFMFLMFGHFLADYPLQGDFLAKGKDPNGPFKEFFPWTHALFAHAAIHAGFVFLFTGSKWCAFFELTMHAWIDYGKCKKWIGIHIDQILHVACKVFFLVYLFTNYLHP